MSGVLLDGPKSSIEGRIERLQIMRSDGTIRESKIVNIHNTIVNTGLDNILTVGGFSSNSNTNNNTVDFSSTYSNRYVGIDYHAALWLRMLWFMKLGTETNNKITLYDMTDLVQPYVNANNETYSQSHYIPTSTNLSIRGTTHDSMIAGDVHSTHRITTNSVKVTENNVEITEVGFFVGVNNTWTSATWANQAFSVGDMFCRIALGEHKVTLNEGERLVVTYALTEYAGATTHQAINDIHLVDSNGNPIQYEDTDGVKHTIGAIGRIITCDGKPELSSSVTPNKLPGDFTCVHPTSEYGYLNGMSRSNVYESYSYYYRLYGLISLPSYAYASGQNSIDQKGIFLEYWNNYSGNNRSSIYLNNFRVCCNPTWQCPENDNCNDKDIYGFPSINTKTTMSRGSALFDTSNNNSYFITVGRCKDNNTDPTPYSNTVGYEITNSNLEPRPTIAAYTRGNFYRDQEWVIPTYMPHWNTSSTTTLPDPRNKVSIWWFMIRNMMYKIGYFVDEGNISTFVQCPIVKKYGQVFRCTFREHVGRHIAGA